MKANTDELKAVKERLDKALKSAGGSEALQKELESLKKSEGEAKESQTKTEAELASLGNLKDELAKVQQELANEKQSPKALGEAKALRKLVGELRESRNNLAQELVKAGKEAPPPPKEETPEPPKTPEPPQKRMPSREEIVALTQAIKKDQRDVKLMQKLANLYISY